MNDVLAEIESIINQTKHLKDYNIRGLMLKVSDQTKVILRGIISRADQATRNEIARIERENHIKIDSKMVATIYETYRFFYINQYLISEKSEEDISSYFKDQTELLSNLIKESGSTEEALKESLPKAYALAMSSCKEALGKTPYMVQIIGAINMNDGVVSEMATGEGKTITSAMPAYLNALTGNGAHIITPNSYLAKRDYLEMQKVYTLLGMSSGYTSEDPRTPKIIEEKKAAYQCDIVYGSASAFAFDYLNDTLETDPNKMVLRDGNPNFAVIDEVDAVLFDDAAIPYNISGTQKDERLAIDEEQRNYALDNIYLAILATKELEEGLVSLDEAKYEEIIKYDETAFYKLDNEATIIINEKTKEVTITTLGYAALFCYYKRNEISPLIAGLNISNKVLYQSVLNPDNKELNTMFEEFCTNELGNYYEYINNAIKAWYGMQLDRDYILKKVTNKDNEESYVLAPVINGRTIKGRHYSEGMQQALEAKEKYLHPSLNIKETKINNILASIPASSFFARYRKVAGMTGTSVENSFEEIYKLYTHKIPRNKKKNTKSYGDVLSLTEEEKFEEIFKEVLLSRTVDSPSYGQPLLITTTSIENSHKLARYLEKRFEEEKISIAISPNMPNHIPVLNANVSEFDKEAAIVKKAGKFGAITIATEMAGRGTDIKLGGEVPSYETIFNRYILEYIKTEEAKLGRSFTSEEKDKVIELAKKSEQLKDRATKRYEMLKRTVEIDHAKATSAGGLKVIGCGHFKYERVDNQVKGRCGRQGDVGSFKFFIDMDDLREIGVEERIISKLQRKIKKNPDYFETIWGQKKITKIITQAQKRAEARQESHIIFSQRFESSILEFRSLLFKDAARLKKQENYIEYIERYIKETSKRIIINSSTIGNNIFYSRRIKSSDIKTKDLIIFVKEILGTDINEEEISACKSFNELESLISSKALTTWNDLINVLGPEVILPAIKKKVDVALNRAWNRFMFNVDVVRNQYISGAVVRVGSDDDIKANIELSFDYSVETEIVDLLSSIFNINYGKKGHYIDRLRDLEVTTSRFTTCNIELDDIESSKVK